MAAAKDSIIYLTGEVIKKSIPFALLPYLTRKLGPDGFGELAYYQIFISFFVVIIGISQASSVARYFYRYGHRSVEELIVSNTVYSLFVTMLIVAPLLYLKMYLLVFACLIASLQELVSNHLSLYQCQRKPILYTMTSIFVSLLSVLLTFVLFEVVEASIDFRLLAMMLAYFIVWVIAFFLLNFKKLNLNFRKVKRYLIYSLSFGAPLLGHQFSILMKGQLDRVIISEYYTISDLGVYSAGFQVSLFFSVVIMACNRAVTPYLFASFKNKFISVAKLINISLLSLILVPIPSLLAWSIDEKYYLILVGKEFVGVKYYAVVFILGQMLLLPYVIIISYFFYTAKTKMISIISVGTSFVYIAYLYFLGQSSLYYLPVGFALCNLVPYILLVLSLYLYNEGYINA